MESKYNELLLSVDLNSWQITSTSHGTMVDRTASEETLNLYRKIMKRDDNTCYYCKFKSDKWQEIHHLNDVHTDFSEDNLTTVCPLCHQSFHLNSAFVNNGAELIWLPELTQQELNHLCRMLFIAEQIKEDYGLNETNTIASNGFSYIHGTLLSSRKSILNNKIGEGCSDIGKFAQVLLDIKNENRKNYINRHKWIKNFKLLHKPSRFHLQTQYWKENNFKNLSVHDWIKLIKKDDLKLDDTEVTKINNTPVVDLDY